jgi:hypothetical protein
MPQCGAAHAGPRHICAGSYPSPVGTSGLVGLGLAAIVVIAVIARAVVGARRAARRRALREDVPVDLPAPVAMVWIPTARKRRASSADDPYGALAPGALEDRARKH